MRSIWRGAVSFGLVSIGGVVSFGHAAYFGLGAYGAALAVRWLVPQLPWAAAIALGMQAEVVVLDKDIDKLRAADRIYQGHMQTVASNAYEVERAVLDADVHVGETVAVFGAGVPGQGVGGDDVLR